MRNLRFRRLGLLGVATTLALVGAVLSPAAAIGPSGGAPGITIGKSWAGSVNNGGTATATITLNNTGGGAVNQTNVSVTDIFDPGLNYTGPAAISNGIGACVLDNTTGFRRVECTGLNVPAGSIITIALPFTGSYWGYRHYTKNFDSDERLDIQKAETHVDIWSDSSTTATVTCPANYDLLDHSWHLQQVDQDTGDFEDIYVMDRTVNHNSATYTLFNDAGGKAQGKLWAVCLKNTTNLAHPVVWVNQQVSARHEVPDGPFERPFYAECNQGFTPVAINIRATTNGFSDPDSIYMDDLIHWTGLEADGSRRATIWAIVRDHARVELQWRCLSTSIGTKRLTFNVKTDQVLNVPMHDKVAQKKITCDVNYKGIVGGWRGGRFNGSEPQPISRVYWLWHDGPGTKNFTGKLLCLKKRLVRGGKVQKNGTITDLLFNHARGTTQGNTFYINNTSDATTSATQLN